MSDNDDNNKNQGSDTPSDNEKKFDPSRRRFVKNTGIAIGGVAGGSLLGGLLTNQFTTKEESTSDEDTSNQSNGLLHDARTFFSRQDDFNTLADVTERIYPEDDNGPGAIALGVPYFIDKQLSGAWGTNDKDYTKGPFKPQDSDDHGLQTKLNRGDMFLVGLRRMQEVSQDEHDEKFTDLDAEEQDKILEKFESGDVDTKGMPSDTFFQLLRQTTLEGVYADPAYGGNKDMQGWKMMEYPGPRMAWADDIETEDFLTKEPASLREYQGGDV